MGPFLFFIAIAIIPILFGVLRSKEVEGAWRDAAARLGWLPPGGGLLTKRHMAGTYHGFRVEVRAVHTGSGAASSTSTVFCARIPDLGLGLHLTREGFGTQIKKLFGTQDIEVGDRVFDDATVVKGDDPAAVRRFLTGSRRARIHRFVLSHDQAEITDSSVEFATGGTVASAEKLVRGVEDVVLLASSLVDGDRPADRKLEKVLAERRKGRIGEALAELGFAPLPIAGLGVDMLEPPPGPLPAEVLDRVDAETALPVTPAAVPADGDTVDAPDVEERVVAGELLYLAGRHEEAKGAFEAARETAPEDGEIGGWIEQCDTKLLGAGSGEAERDEAFPDVAEVCAALFAEGSSTFETMRRFEADFEGRTVRWQGTLQRAESFSYDFVLGSEPGTKATVEVGRTEPTMLAGAAVFAVVGLPPGAEEELRDREGEPIGFEGSLVKADGFMKILYVAGARLV